MSHRLTLPLLLLAALLAGGAFFWLTGSEGRGGGPRGPSAPADAPAEPEPAAELAAPEVPAAGAPSEAPAREQLAGAAPAAPRHAPAAKDAGTEVRGTVIDRFGAPVAGAQVTLAAQRGFALDLDLERDLPWLERRRTETDAEGRFRFEGVGPGTHQALVRASGFAPFEKQGLVVAAGATELTPFELTRGAILTGVVVDPDGRGVPGAEIVPAPLEQAGGILFAGDREPTAVAGPDGRFRVDQLACGAWRFVVRSTDHPDLVVEGLAEEPGVEVAGLRWQLAPGATIAGTVTGVPAPERGRLEVRARRGSGSDPFAFAGGRSAAVEPNGSFVLRGLDVGAGYTLQARRARSDQDVEFWERSRSDTVQARAGESGVVLTYQPEAAVLFTVYDAETRQPLERFKVEAGIDWPAPLRDDEGRTRDVFPGGSVRVGGLRPASDRDRVQVVVRATGYEELSRSDIAVRAGQELDLGAIYVRPVPVVRVRVVDERTGEPVADASVRLQKQSGGDVSMRRTIAVGDGEGLDELEIGEGRSARTDADGWAVLTSYEGATVDVTAKATGYAPGKIAGLFLPPGKSVEQTLALTLGGEVLVTAIDAAGEPLPGARIEHRAPSDSDHGGMIVIGGGPASGVVTDSEGRALFPNLAPGLHSFRIGDPAAGGGAAFVVEGLAVHGLGGADDDEEWTQASVGDGERTELTLRAAPLGRLAGRVREAGKALAGATLTLAKERPEGEPRGPRFPGMDSGPEVKSDGDGRYRFEDVKEGRYVLTVTHPTRRMPSERIVDLREGENTFDVDLPVTVVSGRVLDEAGKPLAGVRVWPERKAGDGQREMRFRMVMIDDGGGGGVVDSGQFGEQTTTDADGRYTLRGVASDTDLVVKAEGDTVQPGESEVVRLAPDQVKEGVDLRLEAAGSVRVEARLADGSPARFQLVQAEYLGDAEPRPEPKFGFLQEGSTVLKGLKPGPWRINVRSAQGGPGAGGTGEDREVTVVPQEETTATFEVE